MIGMYVHVPFCARRCRYCDFTITTAKGDAAHRRFLRAIASESDFWAPKLAEKKFETLYFGGGTPSRLSPGEWKELVRELRARFCLARAAETTIEINPEDADAARAAAWRASGVTRASVGAQSFREASLRAAGRSHGASQIARAVKILRDAGFSNLNLDLILALPGETPDDVRRSVERLLALSPEHVSLYELVVEPGTLFARWESEGKLSRPREEAQLEMLQAARAGLRAAGFRHYELLNFAKPGFESKHNLLYWANREYLGLGPGAFSHLGGRRFRLARGVEDYYRKIDAGDFSAADEETLPPRRRAAESFVLALRLEEGAPASRFAEVIERKHAEIMKLLEKELIESDDRGIRLTERGKLFAETVFSELI